MYYVWDERQFAVKDNAQELSFLYDRNEVPFSKRVGSGWSLHNLQKCMHTVLEGEN